MIKVVVVGVVVVVVGVVGVVGVVVVVVVGVVVVVVDIVVVVVVFFFFFIVVVVVVNVVDRVSCHVSVTNFWKKRLISENFPISILKRKSRSELVCHPCHVTNCDVTWRAVSKTVLWHWWWRRG